MVLVLMEVALSCGGANVRGGDDMFVIMAYI
jgi:hypothetical protein